MFHFPLITPNHNKFFLLICRVVWLVNLSTFPLCSQLPAVFYHSVIHGLWFLICLLNISKTECPPKMPLNLGLIFTWNERIWMFIPEVWYVLEWGIHWQFFLTESFFLNNCFLCILEGLPDWVFSSWAFWLVNWTVMTWQWYKQRKYMYIHSDTKRLITSDFPFFVAVFSRSLKNEKCSGNTRLSARVPIAFLVLANFNSCFYNFAVTV